VNFGPVTPEFKKVECAVFIATRPQFDDRPTPSYKYTGVRKRIGISQFEFQQVIQQSCTATCTCLTTERPSSGREAASSGSVGVN